jgi:hypothetical protein
MLSINGVTYIASELLAQVLAVHILRDSLLVQGAPEDRNSNALLLSHKSTGGATQVYLQLLLVIDVDELLVAIGRVGDIDLLSRQQRQHVSTAKHLVQVHKHNPPS